MLNLLSMSMDFSYPPSVSLDGYNWADGSYEANREAATTAIIVATAVSIVKILVKKPLHLRISSQTSRKETILSNAWSPDGGGWDAPESSVPQLAPKSTIHYPTQHLGQLLSPVPPWKAIGGRHLSVAATNIELEVLYPAWEHDDYDSQPLIR